MVTIDEFARNFYKEEITKRNLYSSSDFFTGLQKKIQQHGHLRFGYKGLDPSTEQDNMQIHQSGISLGINGPPSPYDRYFLHDHTFYELAYVYRGSCYNFTKQGETLYQQGDFLLMAPTAVHATHVPQMDYYLFNLLFTENQIFQIVNIPIMKNNTIRKFVYGNLYGLSHVPESLEFLTGDDPLIRNIVEAVILELIHQKANYLEVASCGAGMLFAALERYQTNQEDFYQLDAKADKILAYMREHFHCITLTDLSSHFSYSTSYLSHQIKRWTGVSFSELVLQLKLKQACRYLEDSNMTLQEIAEKCGFYDTSSFCRQFKKNYRVTPSVYRHNLV